MDTDGTLLRRVRTLDETALAEVFDTYYLPLYRYIYHYAEHVETAEDLTGEVFRRLLEHLATGRGPRTHLKAWLFRVARNVVVDEARRLTHRDHQPLDERLQTDEPPVDDQAAQAILAAEAQRALRHLTPKQRSVIALKYLAGMDNAEVSHVLALPVGAVKALQHRGLAALRRHLSQTTWGMEGDTP